MQKFLRTLMLMALMIVPFASQAQLNAMYQFSTGVDATKWYTLTTDSVMLLDAASFTTSETATTGDSKKTEVTNIGFTFSFAGVDYTQFSVNSDGTVRLGSTQVGTSGYSNPFSASNANTNAPKICGLGCDGCMVFGDYIAYEVFGTAPERVCVIEVSTGTYNSTTRSNHYKFQVQLAEEDNSVTLIYSPVAPAAGPNTTYQLGASASASDIVLFNVADNTMTTLTAGTTTNNASGTWPAAGRYYTIAPDADACLPVTNLTVSNITSSSATLTWHGEGVSYTLYEYGNPDSAAYIFADTVANLVTLEPNTEYTFGVTATCANDNESNMTTVTFRTACVAFATLPYTMGFEESEIAGTASADAFPFCWTRINTLASGTYTYYPYSSSSNSYAGSRKLHFYASSYGTYADTTGFVMPELDVVTYPMNTTRVTFWAKVTSTTPYTVLVGTMTDPTDRSTFSLVESVTVSGTNYTMYAVSMATASATAPYVAFLVPKVLATMYIDDVTIEEMPSCLEITNLAAGNITSSSVDLTWSDAVNASATYTVYNMADTSVIATGVAGTTYAVTGLDANTQYTFGVAANCPAGNASIMAVSARTACGAETMPWSENFDTWTTKSPCWSFLSGAYNMGAGTPTTTTSGWAVQTTYGSYITISGKALGFNLYSTNRYWAVTPGINITSNDVMLSVDVAVAAWSAATPNYDADDTLAFAISTDGGSTFTNLMVLDNTQLNALGGTYTTINVPVAGYTGQTVRFAIFGGSSASGGDNRIVIDNVSVMETPSCMPVTGLTLDSQTATSANVHWVSTGATGYEVEVRQNEVPLTTVSVVVADTTAVISGLAIDNDYEVVVRAICGNDYSPWSSALNVHIGYCMPNPTSIDNSGITTVSFGGMTNTASHPSAAPYYGDYSAMAGTVPAGLTASVDITFATGYTYGTIIWVDWNNSLTFDADEVVYRGTSESTNPTTLTATFDIPATQAVGNYRMRIAAADSYFDSYVSDPTSAPDPCFSSSYAVAEDYTLTVNAAPSCMPVSNLAADNITTDGATLTWTGDATSYNVYALTDGGSITLVQNVTATTITLTGLTAMTQYTYGVRSVCGTDESDMMTVTFATACSAVALPFTETFEATSATTGCWTTDGPGTWTIGTGDYTAATGAYEGSLNAKITHGVSGDTTKLISPVLSGVTNGLQLTFAHIQRSWAGDIDNLAVYYRTSSDAVWQQLAAYTNEVAAWTVETINIPGTVYQVAFEYTDNYGYGVGVDSVVFVANAVPDSVHITYAVNDATMGTTNPAPGTYTYVEGEAFSVTAVPATGYHLVDWQMALNIPDYGSYTEMLGTDTLTFGDTVYAIYEGMVLTAIFAADGGDTTIVECDPVTIPFVETFETTSATADCWTTDGPGTWTIATGDYSAATGAYEGSLNAKITHGTSGDVTKFISPVLSGVTNGMQLQFAHIQRSWYGDIDNLAVYYRTSSDATWQQLAAYTNEVAAWTVETINIPGTVYQVAFEYTDNYGYGVGIDSIAFNLPPACMPVVNLTASNITATGATLSWTGSAASYNVYAIVDSVATLVQNVTVDSIDLTGLTAMTAYTYGVRAVCGTDESEMTTVTFATACGGETCNIEINGADSYGDGWNGNAIQVMQAGNVIATFTIASGNSASAQIPVCSGYPVSFAWVSGNYPSETSFEIKDGAGMVVYSESGSNLTGGEVFYTMNDACPSCIPAMVAIDTITETSVTISWTGTAASYDVYNGTTLVTNTTNNTYTFTGLTPATTYTFGVQAICSATDTAALATITVTTACADITTLPYMEGFENGLGCWSTVNGSADGMPWYAINSADYAHTGASLAASFSYYNYSSMHADAWLISPKFVLPTVNAGDTLNFSWWYRVDAGYPLDLYDVMLSTTTDDTTAFTTTLLAVIPDSNNGEYTQMVVDLTAYAGQSIYLAFHHHDSYDQDFLMIDDIFMGVGAAPVPEPDTLTVTFAVNDATMGTTVPAPGTYQYLSGDTLSFRAMPNTGYIFNGWVIAYGDGSVDSLSVDYISASAPADIFMNYSPMTITALFGTVDPNSDSMQVNVAVNDPTMGTTIPAPGTHYFHVGEVASVVAVPNDGYHLTGWTVNVVSEGVTYVDTTYNYAFDDVFDLFGGWVVSESNAVFTWTVTANFAAGEPPVMHDSVTVNVSVNNETMGVVTPAPGTHYYVLGDTVIMSIMPNPGYRVVAVQMSATHPLLGTLSDETITDSLELAELVGVNDTLIVDDEEMYGMVVNINVIFAAEGTEPTTYSVEVAYDQTKGTVTGAGDYVEGSNVRLVAMPAPHYEFYAWLDNNTGDTVSRESVYAIANIDRDYFLTAIFVASTGIDDVDMDNVTIYSTDNVIVVRGAEGKQVTLFDVNGRMLSREARAAENVEFRVNNSGVYLVKVANAAAKRVVVIR